MFNVRILSIVLVYFISCVTLIADESQSADKASVDLAAFITKSGFKKDDVVSLLRFGTPDLKKQYENADEFDREEIMKTIKKKQDEIKSKQFFIEIPYFTDEIKIEGDKASARLVIPIIYFNFCQRLNNREFVDKLLIKLKLENKIFESTSFEEFTYCHPLVKPQYAVIINELMTQLEVNIGKELAEEGGKAIYLKTNLGCPILLYNVSGTKEAIKNIVRQKEQYRIKIELTGLYFVETIELASFYYYYSELKSKRFISVNVHFPEEDDSKEPDIWMSRAKEKVSKIWADITEIKFIDTKNR
ncbi:MAG: hypothetical protein LBE18_09330 [Planctomycetaceae bacterium]|nr:hypothetical protein [Planctomycetaceae bacterium]